MFYKQEIEYVKASNEVYIEKQLIESFMSNFMHGFMSMESTAEAYNEAFRNTISVHLFKEELKNYLFGLFIDLHVLKIPGSCFDPCYVPRPL